MIYYYLLAFFCGAFTMTLELVASRLAAPYVGVSLYTWTSVIGVVLAGISAGSFTGGWMSDRFNPRRLLSYIMILSGLVTAAILPALPLMGISWPASWLPVLKVVVPVTILFGVPSFLIGCISPVIYRICIQDLSSTGRTVGRLTASGSLGSIAGTFATGFYLIPAMGTRTIVYCVAAGLVIMGIMTLPLVSRKVKSGAAAAIVIAAVLAGSGPLLQMLRPDGIEESAYYAIKVVNEADQEVGFVKKLVLDSLIHSAANPDRPDYLWYQYEKVSAWLMQQVLNGESPTAFFIGGGGYTLPYWLEYSRPKSSIEVAEIDPAVTRVAKSEFISPRTRIISHNMDARMAFKYLPREKKYDFIYGDAFNDLSVPYHLTTYEFGQTIKSHLKEEGIYVANIVDKPTGDFLRAFAHTLSNVFPHVYILPGSDASIEGRRGPNLVVSSLRELPWESWYPKADLPFKVEARKPEKGIFLTDDYAPVDNLLLPIFAERL